MLLDAAIQPAFSSEKSCPPHLLALGCYQGQGPFQTTVPHKSGATVAGLIASLYLRAIEPHLEESQWFPARY